MSRMISEACRRNLVLGIATLALTLAALAGMSSDARSSYGAALGGEASVPAPYPDRPDLSTGERHDGIVRRTPKRLGGAETSRSDASGDKLPDVLHAEDNPGVFISSHGVRTGVALRRPAVPAPGARFLSRAPPVAPAM